MSESESDHNSCNEDNSTEKSSVGSCSDYEQVECTVPFKCIRDTRDVVYLKERLDQLR